MDPKSNIYDISSYSMKCTHASLKDKLQESNQKVKKKKSE